MERQTDRWKDGQPGMQAGGEIDRQTDCGRMDGQRLEGQTDRQTGGKTWMDSQPGRWKDKQADRLVEGQLEG